MKPPSRRGDYESPYTAVLVIDGVAYVITERRPDGFVARRLSKTEAKMVRSAFDDVHADLESSLGVRHPLTWQRRRTSAAASGATRRGGA